MKKISTTLRHEMRMAEHDEQTIYERNNRSNREQAEARRALLLQKYKDLLETKSTAPNKQSRRSGKV